MIPSLEQRHAAGGRLCPCFSSSKSSSSTTNLTKNADMRVVGGEGSANVSANESIVSVMTTDHGAVQAGMTLGTQAIDAATVNTANTLAASKSIFQGALTSNSEANSNAIGAVTSANERLALAYQSGQAGDQTSLKYAGFVVIGLAAVMLLKK